MYSVLSAFTRRLMPLAAHSRLSSRDSAWAGVFASNAMSSASSASIIVCAGYLLLLAFSVVKPFSVIKSTDVRNLGRLLTGIGANVSPLQHTCYNVKAVCVSICDGFFRETVSYKYLLYLPSVYGVKCLGEIYK